MAGTRRGFVTGGTWCVDLNKMIDFWPPEDSIAEIHQIDVRGGGSGSNLAIDMKKLDPVGRLNGFQYVTLGEIFHREFEDGQPR